MASGKLNVSALVGAYLPFVILTPFYCLYMATVHKQEKPFPGATITSTACHYPQDIAFRYFMLIVSSILALIFFMLFRWTVSVAKQAGFEKPIASYLYKLSLFSILLYGITIGTIDEKGTGPLHGPCAVIFFLILILAIIELTLYLTELRAFNTSVLNLTSLRAKQLLAGYLIAVWIYCIIMIIIVSIGETGWESKTDKFVNIVEWNTVTIGLLWVLSFCWEWKQMNLCLIQPNGELFVPSLCKMSFMN